MATTLFTDSMRGERDKTLELTFKATQNQQGLLIEWDDEEVFLKYVAVQADAYGGSAKKAVKTFKKVKKVKQYASRVIFTENCQEYYGCEGSSIYTHSLSWIKLWEKMTNRKRASCSVFGCTSPAEHGAHVVRFGDTYGRMYIVPTCPGHNERSLNAKDDESAQKEGKLLRLNVNRPLLELRVK